MSYLGNRVFKKTQERLKTRTGIDIEWLFVGYFAYRSGKETIPQYATKAYDLVKAQATSSITIGHNDSAIQTGIMRYARAKSTATAKDYEDNEGNNTTGKLDQTNHGSHCGANMTFAIARVF